MGFRSPAGPTPPASVWDRGRGVPSRILRAGLLILSAAAPFVGDARGEPLILYRMNFFQDHMPPIHPVFDERKLLPPPVLELGAAAEANPGGFDNQTAAWLVERGSATSREAILDAGLSRQPRAAVARKPRSAPFALLETMPASYAGAMFGIGWLLLLVSAALGYMGREKTPYSADDPATWDQKAQRPLASIVLEAKSEY